MFCSHRAFIIMIAYSLGLYRDSQQSQYVPDIRKEVFSAMRDTFSKKSLTGEEELICKSMVDVLLLEAVMRSREDGNREVTSMTRNSSCS